MRAPDGWDAATGVAACDIIEWSGQVYRGHRAKYAADDPTGSLLWSGRFNCGARDPFKVKTISAEVGRIWAALYLALGRDISIGEMARHAREVAELTHRYTRLEAVLQRVLDCRNLTLLGLEPEDLWDDFDYRIPQRLALAAIDREAEAILVPSATLLGDNLIVFPEYLQPDSKITILDFIEPNLYVDRS